MKYGSLILPRNSEIDNYREVILLAWIRCLEMVEKNVVKPLNLMRLLTRLLENDVNRMMRDCFTYAGLDEKLFDNVLNIVWDKECKRIGNEADEYHDKAKNGLGNILRLLSVGSSESPRSNPSIRE